MRWLFVAITFIVPLVAASSASNGSPGIITAWETRYDHTQFGGDEGDAICMDRFGNTYVAGTSWGDAGGQYDIVLLKYDAAGTLLWTARYDSTDGRWEEPTDVALDSAGFIWIAGTSYPIPVKPLLLKFTPDGTLVFDSVYQAPDGGGQFSMAIAFDTAGTLYAACNATIFAVNSNGNVLWCDTALGNSYAGIAVDPAGNAYACRKSGVRAYTADGALRWVYNSDRFNPRIALTADHESIYYSGRPNYTTTKLDTSGAVLWEKLYGQKPAIDMGVDHVGNVYLTGMAGTIKYDPDGLLLWFVGLESQYSDENYVAVDSSGRAYVTAQENGMFTRCISTDGVVLWGRTFFHSDMDGWPQGIACTNDGSVVVTGRGLGPYTYDAITVRYDQGDCIDTDGDLACDEVDLCPSKPDLLQQDYDLDGIGDSCDYCNDLDDDGYADILFPQDTCLKDNCYRMYNPDQLDSDQDGQGDLCDCCTDSDGDGWGDPGIVPPECEPFNCSHTDNCRTIYNPDQADTNSNGVGDACECACQCHADPACDSVKSDIIDVVSIVNVAFRSAAAVTDPSPTCPREATDVDCSSGTDVVDVVRVVNVAFRNGNPAVEFCNPCP